PFLRQRGGEFNPAGHPSLERGLGSVSRRRDQEPTRHRGSTGEVERLRAGFLQHRRRRRRLDSHDEVFAVNADAHVATEEEGDPAEQFFLGDSLVACERVADARGLGLRIAHAFPERQPPEGSKTMTSAGSMDRWKTTPTERRGIGVVYQSFALFPHLSVADNVGYGLRARRVPTGVARGRIAEMLDLVHLQGKENRLPRELSGGERQRVALARALCVGPK